jgi:hypothetical protein
LPVLPPLPGWTRPDAPVTDMNEAHLADGQARNDDRNSWKRAKTLNLQSRRRKDGDPYAGCRDCGLLSAVKNHTEYGDIFLG